MSIKWLAAGGVEELFEQQTISGDDALPRLNTVENGQLAGALPPYFHLAPAKRPPAFLDENVVFVAAQKNRARSHIDPGRTRHFDLSAHQHLRLQETRGIIDGGADLDRASVWIDGVGNQLDFRMELLVGISRRMEEHLLAELNIRKLVFAYVQQQPEPFRPGL